MIRTRKVLARFVSLRPIKLQRGRDRRKMVDLYLLFLTYFGSESNYFFFRISAAIELKDLSRLGGSLRIDKIIVIPLPTWLRNTVKQEKANV